MNSFEILALLRFRELTAHWDRVGSDDWARVLLTFPVFSGAGRRRLRKLARGATLAEFAPGETVLADGDNSDSLYLVLSGAAKALGKPAARQLRVGDYFGEMAVIDGLPRSATVIATRELHVMSLPARSVLRLARKHPAIALTMLRNLSEQLRRHELQAAR